MSNMIGTEIARPAESTPVQFAEWAAMTIRQDARFGGAVRSVDFGNGPLCACCAAFAEPSESATATFMTADCYNCGGK